jgi:hypothetical protein
MKINTSKKNNLNLHSARCQILMDVWILVTLTWCYGYSCNGVAMSWIELHHIYSESQLLQLMWLAQ